MAYYTKGVTVPEGVTSSSQVKDLQKQLISQGANIKADGVWGPKSAAAYQQYGTSNVSSGAGASSASSGTGASNASGGAGFTGYRDILATFKNNEQRYGYQRGDTVFTPSESDPTKGYLEHRSGYKGNAIYDQARNKYYTDYGALIREDNHIYTPGSILSPNGMYEDTGNGFVFNKYASVPIVSKTHGNFPLSVAGSMTGAAPGTRVSVFDDAFAKMANGGGDIGGNTGGDGGGNTDTSLEDAINDFLQENSRDKGAQDYYLDQIAKLLETTEELRLKELQKQQTGTRGY